MIFAKFYICFEILVQKPLIFANMAKVVHILALLTHFYLIFKNVSTKVENMTFQFARGEKYILLNLVIFAETTFISHACEQIQDLWTYVLL